MSRATLGAVSGGVVGDDDPARAQLRAQRLEEHRRMTTLKQRIGSMDPERHARALGSMQETLRTSTDRLAEIDAELGGMVEVGQPSRPPVDDITAQARVELRQRLQHLDMVIQRHATPACEGPARRLRNAIGLELRRLDGVNIGTVPVLRRAR